MKKKFKIVYLPIAQKDLMDIFEYILADDPQAAKGFIQNLDKTVSRLGLYPESGSIPNDERLKMMGYRMLVVQHYLVFYVINNKTVEIRRIIHGKRRYEFLL